MSSLKYYCIPLFFLIMISSSCENSIGSLDVDGRNSKLEDIYDQEWSLSSFYLNNGSELKFNSDEKYTIEFRRNGFVGGHADCNSYFGEYSARDGGEIKIGSIGQTLAFCGHDTHEDTYFNALRKVNEYEVNTNELRLGFSSNGILIYK